MKLSIYNVPLAGAEEVALYNTLHGGFACLSVDEYDSLSDIDAMTPDMRQTLYENGFLVDDDFDELAFIEYQYRKTQFSAETLSLTIAPTLQCNLKCSYCYESERQGVLGEEDIAAIVLFAEDMLRAKRYKKMQVNWYGGEPVLVFDQIVDWSKRFIEVCDLAGVEYGAHIITNGTLLTERHVNRFSDCRISNAQITIDGWGTTHDQRRPMKNGCSSFETVVSAALALGEAGVKVSIRMNVDAGNLHDYHILAQVFSDKPNINVHVGHLLDYRRSNGKEFCYFSCREFAAAEYEIFKDSDYKKEDLESIFSNRFMFCGACSQDSYVIDERCNVYRCWNEIGVEDAIVFNLKEPPPSRRVNASALVRYMGWNPATNDACTACVWLPICGGGCVFESVRMGCRFCYPPALVGEEYLRLYLEEVTKDEAS